jgi:hypothetical protein
MRSHSLTPCRALIFRSQVALNQLVLGPVVVSAVFAWSLSWSGRLAEFPDKWRRDTLPTLRKGWAFWVPASSINFACAPLLPASCAPALLRATVVRLRATRGCAPGALGFLPLVLTHARVWFAPSRVCVWRCAVLPPAACSIVPLQYQVLYMSACGIVWTTILSAASATK